MQENNRNQKHAEIAREIRLAKKAMFKRSREGMSLREAADKFVVDVANRFEPIISGTTQPEQSAQQETVLLLAKTPDDWNQLDAEVERLIDRLCGHGDYDDAQALFTLLNLLTNEKYDKSDREIVGFRAARRAFTMTEAFEAAIKTAPLTLTLPGEVAAHA